MKALLLFLLFSVLTLNSYAEDACKEDREKLCMSEIKAREGVAKCMKQNKDQLSAKCRQQRREKMDEAKEVRQACKEDRKTFCGKMKRRDVFQCMRQHMDQLSSECQKEIKEFFE